MESQNIRIAVIHSDRLTRESLGSWLPSLGPISVVYSAAKLEPPQDTFSLLKPDLLILEYGMFDRDGLEHVGRIRELASKIRILMIGVPDTEADIFLCIQVVGVSGYLTKEGSIGDLINNIKAKMRDETLSFPRIASQTFPGITRLAYPVNESWSGHSPHLTCRELEIVNSIEEGLSNKEIAVRLHIEVSTVKNHVHNILDKLKLQDRRSAVRYVKEHGLTEDLH
ncbi:MAG: response regulator transcription factor [Nitrospirales bacterium]|nr:response regulator transcription factor [Nitrospirales bacterium]